MTRMTLLLGKNSSGKSLYGEHLMSFCAPPRIYLATMKSVNKENEERILRHRRQRAHLHCRTIECPFLRPRADWPKEACVLLEDASNLVANHLFAGEERDFPDQDMLARSLVTQILRLRETCRELFVVSISGLPSTAYEGETAAYIRYLNALNHALAQVSDRVVQMVHGYPFYKKGVYFAVKSALHRPKHL